MLRVARCLLRRLHSDFFLANCVTGCNATHRLFLHDAQANEVRMLAPIQTLSETNR